MALLRPEDGTRRQPAAARTRRQARISRRVLPPSNWVAARCDQHQVIADMRPLVAAAAEMATWRSGCTRFRMSAVLPLCYGAAAALVDSAGRGADVVAVKVTEADDDPSTARYLADARLARLKIVQGWDPHLARALREDGGRVGVTSGPMSLAIHQYQHLLKAAERGEWDEVHAAMTAAATMFAAMQDDPKRFADLQGGGVRDGPRPAVACDVTPGQLNASSRRLKRYHVGRTASESRRAWI